MTSDTAIRDMVRHRAGFRCEILEQLLFQQAELVEEQQKLLKEQYEMLNLLIRS